MQHLLRRCAYVFYTLLFGLSVFWLLSPSRDFDATQHTPPPTIDAFMEHAIAFRYGVEGQLRERISVAHWEHPTDGQTTRMTSPDLSLYRTDGTLWHITAQQGIGHYPMVGGTMESVDLQGEVHIAHYTTPLAPSDWAFETTALTLYSNFAQTDQPILVHGPERLEIEAVGLKAYLDTRQVEFLHQVKSYYAINP